MAKLSQIKLGSTIYDIGAAWGNISGKPSTYPPGAHDHDSVYAKLAQPNNLVHSGNEFTFASDAFSGDLYINYRTASNSQNGNITAYRFCKGAGGTLSSIVADTFIGKLTGNADTATKATQDGSGNVITSKYVTLDTTQTISGTKTMTGGLNVSGRSAGGGDDEGIVVGFANNGYAGLCLGGAASARSVFYFKSDGTKPFWRYNNGSSSYDINHPAKSGTIALTSDLSNYLPLSGGTLTGLLNAHGGISLNSSTAQASGAPEYILGIKAFAEGGNVIWQSRANVSVGYADSAGTCTSLSTNAGSATKAIYFSGGKPAQCSDTLNHSISGNANTASLWALTGIANTTTGHSDWDGGVGNTNKYTVYDQEWACSTIGTDTGDLRVFLRPGEYTSGGTEVCFAIDGDYYVMGNKVLHAGNYRNYALPLSGGTMTGDITMSGDGTQLLKAGTSSSWINGRDKALVRLTSYNAYSAISSMKTTNGSWEMGVYTSDWMYFTYCPDTNYNAGNNSGYAQVKISSSGGLYGAVWNDYAEFRICNEDFKPGQVVLENGDDSLSIASQRLQRGCSIISDTFGFAIGETDEAKCPIAVSGRVLTYGYESREEFKKHIGWPVCSGPNGTVSIMTEEEEEKYPSRIIGTISAVPDYETWGTGNVKVDGRIWIKVR